jgi:biotin-(acetyl-CoA carboxylase) ligase
LAPGLAVAWVDHLRGIIAEGPGAWPRSDYRNACVTLGRTVRWDGGEGTATDVGADGHLVVETPEGTSRVVAGDVHLLGHN